MKQMTTSNLTPPKRWEVLANKKGNTEQRKKYLQDCSVFEIEVRRLIRYHKNEIKKAKAHLSEVPKSQHWHFSHRLSKGSIRENKFYINMLRKMLPCRKSLWKRLFDGLRWIFSKRGIGYEFRLTR